MMRNARDTLKRKKPKSRLRNKGRRRHLKTKTKTKRKRNSSVVAEVNAEGDLQAYTLIKYKPTKGNKTWKASANSLTWRLTQQNSQISAMGKQAVTNVETVKAHLKWLHRSDVTGLLTEAKKYYNAGVIQPAVGQAGYQWEKFFIKHVKMKYTIVNTGPTDVNITTYVVISKENRATAAIGDPVLDWENGLDQQQANFTTEKEMPGCNPTESKLFNINWKIKDKKTFTLSPGRTFVQHVKIPMNKILDIGKWNQTTEDIIRGYSGVFFWKQHGIIADDTQYAVSGAGNVTLTPTKVICSQEREYSISALNLYPNQIRQSNDYRTNLVGATVLVVNEASDVPLSIVSAGAVTPANFA